MVATTYVGRKLNLPFCVNVSGEATFLMTFWTCMSGSDALYGSNMNLCVLISFLFLCGGSVGFVAFGIKTVKSDKTIPSRVNL